MIIRMIAPAALFVSCSLFAADAGVSIADVRSLGEDLAHVGDRLEHGVAPSAAQMSALQARLVTMSGAALDANPAVRNKFMAVGARFGKLKSELEHAPTHAVTASMRSQVDLETLSVSHGRSCKSALGFALDRPVRVVLGTSTDAWFFIPAGDAANLRFATHSNGPDPALEVYDGCGAGAKSIGANDDRFGLDADLVVASSQTLYVHLTNSGESGPVFVSAATTVGSVSGTVKDIKSGLPVPNVSVELYTSPEGFGGYAYAYTDQNGAYTMTPSQTGTYFVVASAQSYVTQIYPTGYCPYNSYFYPANCDTSHAKTVTVSSSPVSNVNFAITTGQKIFGQVRSTDKTPVSGANVLLQQPNGQGITVTTTDGAGHYSFSTLAPAAYVLQAYSNGYGSQLYDHVPCAGSTQTQCNVLAANLVAVVSQDLYDIDFSLPRLSTIFGRVTGSDGRAVSNGSIAVVDQNGNYAASSSTDANGNYNAGPIGLGTYYVYASGYTVFPKLYPDHDCVTNCGYELDQGSSFTFSANGQTAQADFEMDYLPSLTGHVSDAASGLPLQGVQVFANMQPPSSGGYTQYNATVDASGYYIIPYMPAGQYYVWAQSGDHVDQIYSGIPCEAIYPYGGVNCNVSGATLFVVTTGDQSVAPFDFALTASGSISGNGTVRAGAGSDVPVALNVSIYDGTGATVASASADTNGNYLITDLAPGSYYAMANANYGVYITQIWQGIDCLTCVPTTGMPIVLSSGTPATGIDFQITRIDAVAGRVVDNHGVPIGGVAIDLFSAGTGVYVSGGATDANGYYVTSAPTGASYYVATEAGGNYTDQVYSGIACPHGDAYDHQCALTGGTTVNVSAGSTQPHIVNFALTPNDRVFANGFE